MPDRILRAELLESESWLALKDNSDRACYIACLLTADNFGQMPAGQHRLVKLWRPYGIDTPEKAAKVFGDLVDVDLLRRYVVDAKPYLYIPKFRQSHRFLGKVWPLSPWVTNEEIQQVEKKSQVNRERSQVDRKPSSENGKASPEKDQFDITPVDNVELYKSNQQHDPHGVGVGVGVGVEVNQPSSKSKAKSKPLRRPPSETSASGEVWKAYATSYFQRYGTEPVRNARVNSQIANFVSRIPQSEAPAVASFYVGSNKARYVKEGHSIGLLLNQAETLRTEWANGAPIGVTAGGGMEWLTNEIKRRKGNE